MRQYNIKRRINWLLVIIAIVFFGNDLRAQNDWSAIQGVLSKCSPSISTPPSGVVTYLFTTGQLLGNGDIGVAAGDTYNSQKFYFTKSDFWGREKRTYFNSSQVWDNSILSSGSLEIKSPGAKTSTASYSMKEDLQRAEIHTTMMLGDALVEMNSWTSDGDNLFITTISIVSGSNSESLLLNLSVPSTYYEYNANKTSSLLLDCINVFPYASGVNSQVLWASRENNINTAVDIKARVVLTTKILGADFDSTKNTSPVATGYFTLKAGSPVQIITYIKSGVGLSSATCPSTSVLLDSALSKINALASTDVSTLQSNHLEWWRNYWMQSNVVLNDDELERYYYNSQYVLGCSFRSTNLLPPNLWGNWITTDYPNWGGRYFLNYNEEAPMYGVFSSNRPEQSISYNKVILNEVPYQINNTHSKGYQGCHFVRSLTPFDMYKPAPTITPVTGTKNVSGLQDQKSDGTFAAMPLMWYYEYTQREGFLRDSLYSFLKELDAFWRDFATKEMKSNGGYRYIFAHSSAHEGSVDLNPDLDLGFAKKVAKLLLEGSKVLNVDSSLRPVWQDFIDSLSVFPTTIYGGKQVFAEAENKNGSVDPANLLHLHCQPVGMEGAVFPGENIYLGGDENLLKIARNTLEQQDGWCVIPGTGSYGNGIPKVWPIAARVGWPAEDLISKFKAAMSAHWRSTNNTAATTEGGIETVGATEGINAMLLQSDGSIIRVFPNWPTARDASFSTLRAKGAVLVSSSMRSGTVEYVNFVSEKAQPITVLNPWVGMTPILYKNGTALPDSMFTSRRDGKITFNAEVGAQYSIRNSGVTKVTNSTPSEFKFDIKNYPNPFNPSTEILYSLPVASQVSLVIYDVNGREVQRFVDEHQNTGTHQIVWNTSTVRGKQMASGMYLVRLIAGKFTQTIKIMLMK